MIHPATNQAPEPHMDRRTYSGMDGGTRGTWRLIKDRRKRRAEGKVLGEEKARLENRFCGRLPAHYFSQSNLCGNGEPETGNQKHTAPYGCNR